MPELSFEVWCSCGNGLCRQTTVTQGRGSNRVEVEPCEICIKKAKEEGDTEGYDRGYDEGYSDGSTETTDAIIKAEEKPI